MKHRLSFVDEKLDEIRNNNLYRSLRHGRVCGSRILVGSDSLLNLCSNDYLGMPPSRVSARQMQSSSRLVSGNDDSYGKLERILARHKSHQKSLVYPTGYMANAGTIPALAGKGDVILSDELNHASIIESCRLSGARTIVYRHNDMDDLADKMRVPSKNKLVITEGIFSMDGDCADLRQITELSQKSGAITVVDDAHGDFAVGRDGRGTPSMLGVSKKIDVYISSLSKGLGSFGGYAASQSNVIDLCINKSRQFIYTSALPSFLVEYSLQRVKSDREKYRKKLSDNVRLFAAGLKDAGFEIKSDTHIIPILLKEEKTALAFGRFLYRNGMFAQPIRYPTVPKGQARLRISVTGWLSKKEIGQALAVFEKAAKKFRI